MGDAGGLLRTLLLPIGDATFLDAASALEAHLDDLGITEDDRSVYVQNQLSLWREDSRPTQALSGIVGAVLRLEPELPPNFGRTYFATHARLQQAASVLTFEDARALLSRTLFIKSLLKNEAMSAAHIALLLNASQHLQAYTWAHVQVVAGALKLRPSIDPAELQTVLDEDVAAEAEHLADASPFDIAESLTFQGQRLGYPGDLGSDLRGFFDPDTEEFEPAFAVILHVNALITQFFDHPLSHAAYEFEPRGSLFRDSMRAAHPSYKATESPYLNNAKGLFAFDTNWAWARIPKNRRRALALVKLLDSLGSMAYRPRRELVAQIRPWLLRLERVRLKSSVSLLPTTPLNIPLAAQAIAAGNTATQGVLEQRLIDVTATERYTSASGWRLRGIGDSVYASNVARGKIGDIEAEHLKSRTLRALEPHGGALTAVYVESHRLSLRQVLRRRTLELSKTAPPGEWTIVVQFIAHDVSALSPFNELVEGFSVSYEFETFLDHLSAHPLTASSKYVFDVLVASPMSQAWVPDEIREALNRLLSST